MMYNTYNIEDKLEVCTHHSKRNKLEVTKQHMLMIILNNDVRQYEKNRHVFLGLHLKIKITTESIQHWLKHRYIHIVHVILIKWICQACQVKHADTMTNRTNRNNGQKLGPEYY